jgi:hypothetical protein
MLNGENLAFALGFKISAGGRLESFVVDGR